MRAILRLIAVSISLFTSAAPAAALRIAHPLAPGIAHPVDGSHWDEWESLDRSILEFDERDCELFLYDVAPAFLLPALEALDLDPDAGDLQGLLTLVWERP